MPGPPKHRTLDAIQQAISDGFVCAEELDQCAASLIRLLKRTGKLGDRRGTPAETSVNMVEHQRLIREAGAEGVVLLKNRNNILPIDLKRTKKIALIGPLTKYAAAHGGGSASLNCHYKISPYDAFKGRLGDRIELSYSKGKEI